MDDFGATSRILGTTSSGGLSPRELMIAGHWRGTRKGGDDEHDVGGADVIRLSPIGGIGDGGRGQLCHDRVETSGGAKRFYDELLGVAAVTAAFEHGSSNLVRDLETARLPQTAARTSGSARGVLRSVRR